MHIKGDSVYARGGFKGCTPYCIVDPLFGRKDTFRTRVCQTLAIEGRSLPFLYEARSMMLQPPGPSTRCALASSLLQGKFYNEKADVWALGCVLYEMTCLKKAFHGDNIGAISMRILKWVSRIK